MTKKKSLYICQECGTNYAKWIGKCTSCNAWDSVIEERVDHISYVQQTSGKNNFGSSFSDEARSRRFTVLAKEEMIDLDIENDAGSSVTKRDDIGIQEFNRVLGGGLVQGSTVLLCGEPGIGKSTLLLQICSKAALNDFRCIYISGEESISQIRLRASRIKIEGKNIKLATATSITTIINIIKSLKAPAIVIIDSIQTLYSEEINSAPGTVSQVKACTFELIKAAKGCNIALIIVGHITKDGQIAGPKVLEHMVDTVLHFEGEGTRQYRIIRTIKNRYGSTNEIGVFEMSGKGLMEVQNPSKIFVSKGVDNVSGTCIFAGIEGSRSLLVEIQSLVVPSFLPTPRRAAIGWDVNRLSMMLAILNARLKLNFMDKEVYLNIAGGLKVNEPALDLAVVASLISAIKNITIHGDVVFFGEVGLSGEIRQVVQTESRVNEAMKLGFNNLVMPKDSAAKYDNGLNIVQMQHIQELDAFFKKL